MVRVTDALRRITRLHRDESGSMSLVSVFSVIVLAVLLGMVINVGRRADRKVKMQNAADAAAYSGGVVLARGMNTLAFTNHLLCDVFAMTAYLREARDRHAETLAGPVLDAWENVAPQFAEAPLPKLAALTEGIPAKVVLERELIRAFSEQNAAVSEQVLPVMEEILAQEMIPAFQHAVIQTTPRLAAAATAEVARRHGDAGRGLSGGEPMYGVLWRTDVFPVGGEGELARTTLPAVDPVRDESPEQPQRLQTALAQRQDHAFLYLRQLNAAALADVDRWGKMSQFGALWRGFTQGQLERLLEEEYPDRNAPCVLRVDVAEEFDLNQLLERDFMFLGVVYWRPMPERLPGLFRNPLDGDDTAFAQVYLTPPKARLVRSWSRPWWVGRQNSPAHWDLMNQNWGVQLVPATARTAPEIVQTPPPGSTYRPHQLGGLSLDGFRRLNTH